MVISKSSREEDLPLLEVSPPHRKSPKSFSLPFSFLALCVDETGGFTPIVCCLNSA
jgi:hypothetical protein